jgi:hypothetical protein
MEKYYGNYLGMVVSKDGGDPERRGRIQVWIPGITNTFYGGWNDDIKNKDIYYIGNDSELSDLYVNKLRSVLPWAECASPLIGGGTSLYYNESDGGAQQTSLDVGGTPVNLDVEETPLTNDKKDFTSLLPEMDFTSQNNVQSQNSEISTEEFYTNSEGEFVANITSYINPVAPSNVSASGLIENETDVDGGTRHDVSSVAVNNDSGGILPDPYFSSEPPPPFGEGTPQGTFSIPRCGSRVWIFFHGGDIQKPVYFAYSLVPTDHKNFYGNYEPVNGESGGEPIGGESEGKPIGGEPIWDEVDEQAANDLPVDIPISENKTSTTTTTPVQNPSTQNFEIEGKGGFGQSIQ